MHRPILTEIDTPIAFSPDGARIAYIVSSELTGQSALMFAGADGRGVFTRAVRTSPEAFTWALAGPLWTADGMHIITAATSSDTRRPNSFLTQVHTATGAQTPLGSRTFTEVGRLAWLTDETLIVAASERLSANQLWRVSYPDGTASQIPRDGANVWTQPLDGGPWRQLTNFASERILRYEWSPDGKSLLYARGTMNNDVVLISNVPRAR